MTLTDLKRLAMAKVTPGPWKTRVLTIMALNGCKIARVLFDERARGKEGREDYEYATNNAAYISAVSPERILAMVACVEAIQSDVANGWASKAAIEALTRLEQEMGK